MTTWYVRTSIGDDGNGGTSPTVRQSGATGVTNGTNTFTASGANFTSADIGHVISIGPTTAPTLRKIVSINSTTSLVFDGATIASASGQSWRIGGAFKNISRALGGISGVVGTGLLTYGDQVWIGPGIYREQVFCDTPAAGTGSLIVSGDITGVNTGDAPGEITVTGWLIDDKSGSDDGAPCFYLPSITSGTNGFTFEDLSCVTEDFAFEGCGKNTIIRRCHIFCQYTSSSLGIELRASGLANGEPLNALVESCYIFSVPIAISVGLTTWTTGVDTDLNIEIRNCVIIGLGAGVTPSSGVVIAVTSAASSNSVRQGGVKINNCLIIGGTDKTIYVDRVSLTYPVKVRNSRIFGIYNAVVSGMISDDYNSVLPTRGGGHTNVTLGTNTVARLYDSRFHIGQELIVGMKQRPFGEPVAGSPLLGFGSDPAVSVPNDIRGIPRPAGGKSAAAAVGPFERANTWVQETTTVQAGTSGLSCIGPGFIDFDVNVDPVATQLKVYMRKDSTYTGTSPKFQLRNGAECGVADQEAILSVAANNWQELQLNFTPTKAGVVTVRLLSLDTNGGGKAFADTRTGW